MFISLISVAKFQSTLPVGGATTSAADAAAESAISIHAPRGGSDRSMTYRDVLRCISIHAPRGGSDKSRQRMRGRLTNFNPRSPWGERPADGDFVLLIDYISIHAPRGGSDFSLPIEPSSSMIFQSTLPVGGATLKPGLLSSTQLVFQSTLPVGGATPMVAATPSQNCDFNPRSPWGERQQKCTESLLIFGEG